MKRFKILTQFPFNKIVHGFDNDINCDLFGFIMA